jgi:hypothetical protein
MRNLNFLARFLIGATGASLIPAAAWGCPACMVGDPKTAGTYFSMTLVLSALPMLLIVGLAYWLWRRHS